MTGTATFLCLFLDKWRTLHTMYEDTHKHTCSSTFHTRTVLSTFPAAIYFPSGDHTTFEQKYVGPLSHLTVENCAKRSCRHPFYRSQWAAAASSASRMKKEKIGQNAISKPDMGENTRWSQSHLI
jgi:hypothetical protein